MVLRMACPTKRTAPTTGTIAAKSLQMSDDLAEAPEGATSSGWYKNTSASRSALLTATPPRLSAVRSTASVERQLKALREGPKALTAKQIAALSGIVYRAFAEGLENNPGLTVEGWLRVAEANEVAKRGKAP